MEPWVLVVLLVVGAPIVIGIWLIVRTVKAGNRIEELSRRLGEVEIELFRLKKDGTPPRPQPSPAEVPIPKVVPTPSLVQPPAPPLVQQAEPLPVSRPPMPPPLKPVVPSSTPPPPIPSAPPLKKSAFELPQKPAINWEQFMGVKGLAYVAGLALFLGVVFFVKYSFERNWITPELRVAIGFLAGVGMLIGGTWLHRRKQYIVGAQTLCATGVLILYATTFACRSIYKFEFFGLIPTFLLMALITTAGFLLAVRLNALVVAILGMLGGFLTPILLSTGVDNPRGLFGYIAILDAGLIFVALNRRWMFLTALAALGTVMMQIGWVAKFFEQDRYFDGDKILITLTVLVGFNALYLIANWWTKRREKSDWWLAGASLGLVAVALAFVPYFLSFAPLAARPWVIFGFVFVIDLIVLALVVIDNRIAAAQPIAGMAVFLLLALWTGKSLTAELLNSALVFYLVLAALHSAVPLLLQRRGLQISTPWNQFFPPLALALVLFPIIRLADVPFLVWPFVLLVDVLAIGLAVLTASLLPVVAVLLLTLVATGALIFKIPAELTGMNEFLILLAVFAIVFVAVGVWLTRKFKVKGEAGELEAGADVLLPSNLAAVLPLFSAALPFLLLIMVVQRLAIANPSPIFGLALLLTVLLLGLVVLLSTDWLPAVGLACIVALEASWHFKHFDPANATIPLIWYLGFYLVFAVFPFVFLKRFTGQVIPWATAALVGVPQFFLIYRLVKVAWPNEVMGLLPAVFAVPALLSLVIVLKAVPTGNTARMSQLAWLGGVALFFITLIFPVQFDRQWITIGWALEGAALLWLFHRVPHPGLRLTGVGLLIAAFVRLTFNRAVFDYHVRSATPILNWYLYTYGIATVCFFVGAWLLAPPRNKVFNVNAPPVLVSLGTVLAFLLLNIEIADYFSAPGSTLTFQFQGSFARDMTYSIAWALFALVLLVAGILKNLRAPRYAALGLLCVTLLKLFFHDLARLGQLYRIGAFIGVAVIAMLASFAYQRFFAAVVKEKETKDEVAQ